MALTMGVPGSANYKVLVNGYNTLIIEDTSTKKSKQFRMGKKRTVTVGRESGSKQKDFSIQDGTVSDQHFFFFLRENGQLLIQDAGSTHGTFLNNENVPNSGFVVVPHYSRIQIGLQKHIGFQVLYNQGSNTKGMVNNQYYCNGFILKSHTWFRNSNRVYIDILGMVALFSCNTQITKGWNPTSSLILPKGSGVGTDHCFITWRRGHRFWRPRNTLLKHVESDVLEVSPVGGASVKVDGQQITTPTRIEKSSHLSIGAYEFSVLLTH